MTLKRLAFPVLGCILALGAEAQEPRDMTIVDLLEVPQLQDPQVSPDGEQVVYVLSEADWKKNKRVGHIWRADRSGGAEAIRLTNGEEGESSPRWSPDGASIAFLATRGEDEEQQIYLLSTLGGEARPLTEHETSVATIEWSPDGRYLYFIADDPKTEEEKRKDELKDDVFAFDENYEQRHLWRIDVESGEEERITSKATSPSAAMTSPGMERGSPTTGRRAPCSTTRTRARSGSWTRTARTRCS